MRKAMFAVTGMTCAACSARVEKAVRQVAGVSEVSVNLLKNSMKVAFDESAVSPAQIADAVRQAGYGAQASDSAAGQGGGKADRGADTLADELRAMRRRLLVSFCFLVPLMYLSMGHMLGLPLPEALLPAAHPLTSAFVQFLLTLPMLWIYCRWSPRNTGCLTRNVTSQKRNMTGPTPLQTCCIRNGSRNLNGVSACIVSSRCFLTCWWNA